VSKLPKAKSSHPIRIEPKNKKFLIESLKVIVDQITRAFGPRCEVVLHDLEDLDHSVVKIANGYVTGRAVGDTISNRGIKYLKNWNANTRETFSQFMSVTKNGRHLKSSIVIFPDVMNKPVVALTINFDVTDAMNFNEATKSLFGIPEQNLQDETIEIFGKDIIASLSQIADNLIHETGKDISAMRTQDKIEIVRQLENEGFFLLKGAIKLIARKLNVSKYTIYNYIDRIGGKI